LLHGVIAKIGQEYRVYIISEKWRCQKASKSGHGRAVRSQKSVRDEFVNKNLRETLDCSH
jgi:hypothetical protein